MRVADLLDRVLGVLLSSARGPSAADLFRRADRLRREGRHDEAVALVEDGLRRSPRSAAGHLLAGYLHLASRRIDRARDAFQSVLALDQDHPRALLGLARIAIESGDADAARPYLERALRYHADFPEARALEEMIASWTPRQIEPSRTAAAEHGLRLPPGARDPILARLDGGIVFSECDATREAAVAQHLVQIARIAGATLSRAGLGSLRRGAIEAARESTYLQADVGLVLAVTLPSGTAVGDGMAEVGRLWAERAQPVPGADG